MPILIKREKTSKGTEYLLAHSTGEVTGKDAEELTSLMSTGGPHFGVPMLGVVDSAAKFTPEARQAYTRASTSDTPVILVVKSAPLRVMLSFVARLSSAAAHTRFFPDETEAKAYIDGLLPNPTPPFPP